MQAPSGVEVNRVGRMASGLDLDSLPPTISVPEAARLLGIGRANGFAAARSGDIPTLKFGRRIVVPTARLLELLGR
jgi:hypothetical protein